VGSSKQITVTRDYRYEPNHLPSRPRTAPKEVGKRNDRRAHS
jgi:hypothetical protein